ALQLTPPLPAGPGLGHARRGPGRDGGWCSHANASPRLVEEGRSRRPGTAPPWSPRRCRLPGRCGRNRPRLQLLLEDLIDPVHELLGRDLAQPDLLDPLDDVALGSGREEGPN